MLSLIEKANTLVEALPYIKNFSGKTFVIKYGGAAQKDISLKSAFAQDVVLLNFIGIHPVVVHGGGPRISEMMRKLGKEPAFVDGQRVTDPETMEIVEMVLGGLINKEIVSLIGSHGGKAIGLTGKDGFLIKAEKKAVPPGGADLGLVGNVREINSEILLNLQKEDFITVITPVGVGPDGQSLNINADTVAQAVAAALKAEKLILLTDVPGILEEGKTVSTLGANKAARMIEEGVISGGMIPKTLACLDALRAGVGKTHILDGRIPHCLLLEIFTREGVGTEITH
ncbi:MAG: acetylglutamate kinase [Nitrospiraceae bacterium]|nr:acetylglutamate kinase [Nitrospiraceae bacterium]MDA8326402.1 acetylglutamate kinase [Nitrospiraceae bacterium]